MKNLFLILTFFLAQQSFAFPTLNCQAVGGELKLVPTSPCSHCQKDRPAFHFIGGEGILAAGISEYDAEMPGFISWDKEMSAQENKDILSLIDGGTWWITIRFAQGTFNSQLTKGDVISAEMDSSYSDIDESELNGIKLTCTVE